MLSQDIVRVWSGTLYESCDDDLVLIDSVSVESSARNLREKLDALCAELDSEIESVTCWSTFIVDGIDGATKYSEIYAYTE